MALTSAEMALSIDMAVMLTITVTDISCGL
jgi:hypothetical protein